MQNVSLWREAFFCKLYVIKRNIAGDEFTFRMNSFVCRVRDGWHHMAHSERTVVVNFEGKLTGLI